MPAKAGIQYAVPSVAGLMRWCLLDHPLSRMMTEAATMPDLADLFPGYKSEWINTRSGRIFARVGGNGPPLLLLHGFSETHVMWHRVAPQLAERFTVIIADLPGYGWSDMPESDENHTPYTKRAMAKVMVEAMEQLGHVHFALAGHDRGGRVAYRLALDHPGRLSKLAVLDILPTYDYWQQMDRTFALKIYHWAFLAQPAPLPEKLILGHPDFYLTQKMASWTKSKTLDAFDPRAMEHYLAPFRDPSRVHAMCEDYRAGAHADFDHDKADRDAGNKITIPMLVLWGDAGIAAAPATPLDTWKNLATNVSGAPIDSGHFLTEENPDATARALLEFFTAG
jgi:haloacetate dehalogenase